MSDGAKMAVAVVVVLACLFGQPWMAIGVITMALIAGDF